MRILYDVISKGAFVRFRGKSEFLKGPFRNRQEAIRAAEKYCRSFGWSETRADIDATARMALIDARRRPV
jgi:hypothetical protein